MADDPEVPTRCPSCGSTNVRAPLCVVAGWVLGFALFFPLMTFFGWVPSEMARVLPRELTLVVFWLPLLFLPPLLGFVVCRLLGARRRCRSCGFEWQ